MSQASHEELIKQVTNVFNTVAQDYDSPALRFFPLAADKVALQHPVEAGHKILDICTGTGYVAQAIAQRLAEGRVTAIDISTGMLHKAAEKNQKLGLQNIDLHEMDALDLQFKSEYFDSLTCSFGVFFMLDMVAALKSWSRVLKPGGTITFTGFGAQAFHPYMELTIARMIDKYQIDFPESPLSWKRMATVQQCETLVVDAGLNLIQIKEEDVSYHMTDANDWWQILMNAGFRGQLMKLSAEQQAELKYYLDVTLKKKTSAAGILLPIPMLLVQCEKKKKNI